MRTVLSLLGLFIMGVPVPAASTDSLSGWYLGVEIGKTEVEVVGHDRSELVLNTLRRDGISAVSAGGLQDDGDISYSVFAGYRFCVYGAVEAAYINLGEVGGQFDAMTPTDTLSGSIESSYRAAVLSLLLNIPLPWGFELFGRGGIHYWVHDFTLKINTSSDPALIGTKSGYDEDGIGLVYGTGLRFHIIKYLAVSAEWR
ncbi:MAG: outer membrane beta-barrel protein, partial [Candidatus Auribacterota bacterium]|nr:outer membrane beta-barrel protein [Candidatus Auribacterota bacterium]